MADGDFTTLDDVKAWLPDMANVTTSDALLSQLITAASRFVCVYTGRPLFDVLSYTEDYDGSGQGFMLLRQWPVVSVQGVTFNCPITGGVGQTLDPSAWRLEPPLSSGGCQRLSVPGQVFPRGRSSVTVSYSSGYAEVPPDVAQATIELVGERFRTRERIGQASKTLGGQETTTFSLKSMNDAIAAMLAPYRRVIPC